MVTSKLYKCTLKHLFVVTAFLLHVLRSCLPVSLFFTLNMLLVQSFSDFFSYSIRPTDFSPYMNTTGTPLPRQYLQTRWNCCPLLSSLFSTSLTFARFLCISITMTANVFGVAHLSPLLLVYWCIVLCLNHSSTQVCLPMYKIEYVGSFLSEASSDSLVMSPFL